MPVYRVSLSVRKMTNTKVTIMRKMHPPYFHVLPLCLSTCLTRAVAALSLQMSQSQQQKQENSS